MFSLHRWLIEFESFSINDCKQKNESNARPLTESSVNQKPQWFKELTQQRRLSETSTSIESNSELIRVKSESFDLINFDDTPRKQNGRSHEELPPNNELLAKSFASLPNESQTFDKPFFNNDISKYSIKSSQNLRLDFDYDYIDFIIPELPFGQELVFEIMTNWGDEDYVGLNGIEILGLKGTDLKVEKVFNHNYDYISTFLIRP
jgi:hypothetical protein